MRIGSLLALVAILLSSSAHATDGRIASIRSRYASINQSLHRCTTETLYLDDIPPEGAILTIYRSSRSIRKLTAQAFSCQDQITEECCFWNDRPFFVLQTRLRYAGLGSDEIKGRSQERFYFSDGKLVRCVKSGNADMPGDSSPGAALESVREWLRLARDHHSRR